MKVCNVWEKKSSLHTWRSEEKCQSLLYKVAETRERSRFRECPHPPWGFLHYTQSILSSKRELPGKEKIEEVTLSEDQTRRDDKQQ